MSTLNLADRRERSGAPAVIFHSAPRENRNVRVISAAQAMGYDQRPGAGGGARYFTRGVVAQAVARGEMRWVDKYHNTATYTVESASTWQKTRSGPVCTMQLIQGEKGRHVPANQVDTFDPSEELAYA